MRIKKFVTIYMSLLLIAISTFVFSKECVKIKKYKETKKPCIGKRIDHPIEPQKNSNIKPKTKANIKKKISKEQEKTKTETWNVVFVHGIISAAPVLSIKTMRRIKDDNINNTLYEKYVNIVRNNSFFRKNQPMQEIGLKRINKTRKDANDGGPALASIFDKQIGWLNPNKKINTNYYTNGWQGFLSNKRRYKDGIKFIKDIHKENAKYLAKGIKPKWILLGFSHGASVCINMALARRRLKFKPNFIIEKLVLLGTPIQRYTDYLIGDPLFKKVYSLYSLYDRVQILDFSSPGKLLSNRRFRARKSLKLPHSLVQARIQLLRKTKKGKRKNGFTARHAKSVKNCSPGHCEWWFFGWTNKFYRKNFAIKPLSIVAITPSIINAIDSVDLKKVYSRKTGNHLRVSIRPYDEIIKIKRKKYIKTHPFLTEAQLTELKNIAKSFPFKKINADEYSKKVQEAINVASTQVQEMKKRKKKRR